MSSTGMINARLNANSNAYRSASYICLSLLLFVVLTVSFVAPLWAANEGSNIPISVEDGGAEPPVLLGDDQQNPFIVALPDKNKWFVVWEDWRNWNATGSDIYGRFINDDGTLCGDEIVISTASGNQTVPTLAYRNSPDSDPPVAGTDNILIAWQDTRGAAASGYLYYNLLDISSLATDCASGATLGSESALGYTSIGVDSLKSRKLPKAAYDTARDQFWVVWVESRDALQRIEEQPFGVASWTDSGTRVAITAQWNFGDSSYASYVTVNAATGVAGTPEIVRNSGTIPVDTDSDDVFDDVRESIRSVRLISHSRSSEEDVYVYEYFKNVNNITVACDESSPETLIVWEGSRGRATLTCTYVDWPDPDSGEGYPDSDDIFSAEMVLDDWDNDDGLVHIFSIFDKYIEQTVVNSQLIDNSAKSSFYPAVGFDTSHRKFLVAWEDRDARDGAGDGVHSKIFGQLLYSGGGLYGENLPISFQDTNDDGDQDDNILSSNQTRPQISIDSTNQRFFVTWQDGRNSQVSLENLDIFGQFVDSEGSLRGTNYAVCVEPANQYNPLTAYNSGNHQFMAVWKDARNLNTTNSDIYGQRFTLGQPQLILLNDDDTALVPPLLDFGSIQEGEAPTLSVKMKNTGDSTIQIDYVTPLAAPYAYVALPPELESVDGLSINLVPGASYKLYIRFAPTTDGTFIDDFTIQSDATNLTVNLQGVRVPSVPPVSGISVSPGSGNFGSLVPGESKSMLFTFSNTGNVDIAIVGADLPTAGFDVADFPATILAGETFSLLVTFSPTVARYYNETLRVFYDNGLSPTEISLTGTGAGTDAQISISVSPTSGYFGSVMVNESKTLLFTFTNPNIENVTIIGTDMPSTGFTVVGLPGNGIDPNDEGTIGQEAPYTIGGGNQYFAKVIFEPVQARPYNGLLRVFFSHGLPTIEIVLSGQGEGGNADVVEPADIDFGQVNIGETNSANLTFTNNGNIDVVITAVDLPGTAFVVSGIPGIIPAYGNLDALVTFSPLLAQNYSTDMRVLYDNGVPASNINLSGIGIDSSAPAVTVSPQAFSFGQVALGTTRTETLVITNTGNVEIQIVAVDLPDSRFTLNGLDAGSLAEGVSKVATVTFTPDVVGDFGTTMRILFDSDLLPQEINLQGSGMDIDVSPTTLNFPNSEIASSTVLSVTITNASGSDLQVKGAVTGTDAYSISGIAGGDIIRSGGGTLTCQVTFKPTTSGYFEDGLYFNIGPVQDLAIPFEEIDWGTQYIVILRGSANADFVISDIDSFTADLDYQMMISASTNQSGQLFVIFSHDPLSEGKIYALTNNGTLQPFPYEASFGWQNLWYLNNAYAGLKLDLSQVDFRPLGCSLCQGQNPDDGGDDFNFGGIIITPPDDAVFNNASDFKYMGGTLYMATYVKNASSGGVFDFNKGLLEMQSLNIHSLSGTWQVTSRYYDVDMVHSTYLVVTEPGDGQISATWPGYYPTMVYSEDGSGYVMTFSIGVYDYTYKISALTEDTFSGSYTCIANGVVVAEDEPVSGVRLK